MKKLKFMLLLGAFVFTTPAFAYKDPTFSSWTNMSERAQADFPGTPVRVLKWVRYSKNGVNDTSLVSGDAVVYDTVSDDGISVNTTTTSGDATFAGICVTAIPTSDNSTTPTSAAQDWGRKNWGWIIVHGPASANVTAAGTNGNSAGDYFITSTDAAKITSNSMVTTNPKAVHNTAGRGGFFFNAGDTTSTSVPVFVKSS